MSFIYRYLALHYKNFFDALARITEQPLGNLMTIVVIGIALALPAGLKVMVNNISTMSGSWDAAADFTIYLEMTVDETSANELAQNIQQRTDVRRAILINRAQALIEFQNYSGFGEALETLQANPLPHALIISPTGGSTSDISELIMALEGMEETALVQLDTAWVDRLRSILDLVLRVVDIVTVLLGFGVIIVIGNTIRLEINNRQDEIEIIKLVGGSNGYVRRPFLYSGFWYGFGGSIVAILTIWGALGLVNSPARALAQLYDSSYRVIGLNFKETLMLVGTGALLGWAGAAIATIRHLRDADPE
ncbi:MAG: permease-like cell division protein FtsX [Gammaproteobacteria bacterium]|nr:permease-like cell division protein FtsX [Gammaproteobacteria bacterium]